MAYCVNCGRLLNDGEICSCENTFAESADSIYNSEPIDESTPVAQEFVPQPSTVTVKRKLSKKALFKAMLLNMRGLFVALVKNPVSAGKSFLDARDVKMSGFLFGIHAFVVFIYALISSIKEITTRSIIYYVGVNEVASEFTEVVASIIISLLITAGVMFGVAGFGALFSKVFGGKTSYKSMLCLSGLNSLLMTPFIILATVLSLVMNVYVIFAVAGAFSLLTLFACFDAVCTINENRKVYAVFCTYISLVVLIRFVLTVISFLSVY